MANGLSWNFTTVPPVLGAPNITDWAPKGNSTPRKPTIMISFDREMDTSSVFSALTINPYVDIASFSHFNTTFNFTLAAELTANVNYTVTVSIGAMSSAGIHMTAPFSWNFTTAFMDHTLPTVLMTTPGDGDRGRNHPRQRCHHHRWPFDFVFCGGSEGSG